MFLKSGARGRVICCFHMVGKYIFLEEVSCAGDLEEVASKWKPGEEKVHTWRGN